MFSRVSCVFPQFAVYCAAASDETEGNVSAVSSSEAVYLLVEPLLAGRRVLAVGPSSPEALERLRNAGAAEVISANAAEPRLDEEGGRFDIVLCASALVGLQTDVERHRWIAELGRVLRPDGLCVVRLPARGLWRRGREEARAACGELLRPHFAGVCVVEESRFAGVSFLVPGAEEIAVNQVLAPIGAAAELFVALCSRQPDRWTLGESLLVPVGGDPGSADGSERAEVEALTARLVEADLERESLRETLMTLQDGIDRRELLVSALRRQAERQVRQLSETAAALEVASLEAEQLGRRATAAEQGLAGAQAELARCQALIRDLADEVRRLRAARGELARLRGPGVAQT